ncbi:TPA: hypothetical protein N0F65_010038 [Lagenidium giganteum]|uniref:Uncharacterized protein n=1 Tax=Lagenidium giganteum TaxID=4803 RepID=A0AAV2ZGZ9_9STRA|nr:TPA: hypothetical protein N0F65_010038 [Lagenidium giganteum]
MGALLSSRERHDCVGYDECARRLEYPHPRSQPKMSERVDLHDACHGPQQAPQSAQQAPPPASALETSSSSCVGNGAPTSTTDCSPAPKKSTKKRVRWSTITIHEFGVGHGGSAVPKNGPSIGLAQTPEFTWSTKVGTMARSLDGVRRFSATERVALLRSAGYAVETIKSFVEEAAHERNSRELYHSHVMKLFRKKRKKRKLSKNHEETSVVTTPTNSEKNAET